MDPTDKTVGYRIAGEVSKDESTEVLYCTEEVVALITQSHIQGSRPAYKPKNVTTVIIDEARNRSAQSDCAIALTLAAAGDIVNPIGVDECYRRSVEKRLPLCQRVVDWRHA